MNSTQAHPNPPVSTQPTSIDWLFLLSCVLALALVAWFGKMNYTEANKTETAKRNGEAVVTWMQEATAGRFEPDFAVAACAGTAPPPAGSVPSPDKTATTKAPNTWGGCLEAILKESNMKALDNPFQDGLALHFAPACNTEDRRLAGNIVIEKITPNPPGSAVPSITSQLVDADSIAEKLALKVSVCDKGSYAVKVAELEF